MRQFLIGAFQKGDGLAKEDVNFALFVVRRQVDGSKARCVLVATLTGKRKSDGRQRVILVQSGNDRLPDVKILYRYGVLWRNLIDHKPVLASRFDP